MRVDLILRTPQFREDQFRDLFKDEPPRDAAGPDRPSAERGAAPTRDRDAAPARDPSKPVEIVFDDIRSGVSILPVGVDVSAQTISPDGKIAAADGDAPRASRTSTSTRSTSCRASRRSRGS